MTPLSRTTAAIGVAGGFAHVLVVGTLLSYFDYQVFRPTLSLVLLAPGVFFLGAFPLVVSVRTRLLIPGGGFLALATAVVVAEVTTPAPQKVGELGGHAIVDGPFYALQYAGSWYSWLSLLFVAGVVEFAIRRGYAIGDDRLRHLPDLPLSSDRLGTVVVVCSAVVGTAIVGLLVAGNLWDSILGYAIGFAAAAAATAVPVVALLARGLVAPLVLYCLVITNTSRVHVFADPDGLSMVFLGVMAGVFAIAAVIEWLGRSQLLGWDGGRFAAEVRLGQ
ncbi:hypothetical protein Halru_0247 [Halovivax ruber XH-70]|uniref:Uncharacterized protein n=1 Tax=Halovivax ruber (strain DSM 18193 / JCM 13892 / XH-70) TaxID=797302 RepID=L0I7X9_HALRX|nr:hypothetical protein [Halovivax ruber]AGB14893.1 hypothetical protein Halru_0247 [Halovivax ruber XH-70]